MTHPRHRLGSEQGQALISGLTLLAGVMIPLLFVVPLFARLEQGRLAAEQAARDAVRAAVQAPAASGAQTAAQEAVARAQQQTATPLELRLDGQFTRGTLIHARVTAHIALATLPLFGHLRTVAVHGDASAPIDRYRSLLTPGAP